MKSLTLPILALLTSEASASRLNVVPGHCPHAPGTLKSKGLEGKDLSKALGSWFTVIHDKSVPAVMGCIGTHYEKEGDGTLVRLTKTGELSAAAKEQMAAAHKDDPNYADKEQYFVNADLSSDFRFKEDPSIGFISNAFYKPNGPGQKDFFDEAVF